MDNVQGLKLLMGASRGTETKDSTAKKLFSRKEILVVIMKHVISEYADCTLEEIMDCIEGDTILVGTAQVSPDMANTIRGETQENQPLGEALSVYDILFQSLLPSTGNKIAVNLHIDLELQKDGEPGYPIENRAIYYTCRKFSSQIQKVRGEDPAYSKLEKVYSIWIVFDNIRKEDRDSISWHQMQTYRTEGTVGEKNVDFLEVVIIRLGGNNREKKLLDFLYAIVSGEKETAFRYMPQMDEEEKMEVDEMFSLTQYAEEKGIRKSLLTLISKKIKKNKSFSQIAEEMEMDEEELRSYYKILEEDPPKEFGK